jgi:hypothetical protein
MHCLLGALLGVSATDVFCVEGQGVCMGIQCDMAEELGLIISGMRVGHFNALILSSA